MKPIPAVLLVLLATVTTVKLKYLTSPNIILLLADDIGVNDVSWNNPAAETPVLGRLAKDGIILDNFYTQPICTPSRAALLTGSYPYRYGLQRGFGKHIPEGLPLNITIMPQYLKKLGYSTHGLGKWHLGFCSPAYTPLHRGFDSYYGLYVGDDTEETEVTSDPEEVADRSGKKKRKGNRNNKGKRRERSADDDDDEDWIEEDEDEVDEQPEIQTRQGRARKGMNKKQKGNNGNNNNNNQRKWKNRRHGGGKRGHQRNQDEAAESQNPKFEASTYAKKAVKIIKNKNPREPFFIYLSFLTKSYPREKKNLRGGQDFFEISRKSKLSEMEAAVYEILSSKDAYEIRQPITEALKDVNEYDNTIIVFMSDNGARHFVIQDPAKNDPNYPLKGSKGSIYEGGTKVPGFIHGSVLEIGRRGHRYQGLIHMVDILPTLVNKARRNSKAEVRGNLVSESLDGIDQWEAITENKESPREIMVYNLDDNFVPPVLQGPLTTPKFQVGIREGDYKLVWGQPRVLHRSYREAKELGGLNLDQQTLELYNLRKDPGEEDNLALRMRDKVRRLQSLAMDYLVDLVPPRFMGLQTTEQVISPTAENGALTGWCLGVETTTCGPAFTLNPAMNGTTTTFSALPSLSSRSMVEVYHGSLSQIPIVCRTELEPTMKNMPNSFFVNVIR